MTGIAVPQHSWVSLADPKPLTQTAYKLQVIRWLCVLEIVFTTENVIQCKHCENRYTVNLLLFPVDTASSHLRGKPGLRH